METPFQLVTPAPRKKIPVSNTTLLESEVSRSSIILVECGSGTFLPSVVYGHLTQVLLNILSLFYKFYTIVL